jgi:hypothetical protein
MTFKILLEDGESLGNYSYKKSPAQVAKSAMKVIYQKTGDTEKDINFFNTHTKKEYTYRCKLVKLGKPEIINIGNKKFYKKYQIFVKRI